MKKLNKTFDFLELRQNVSGGGGVRNMANKPCFTCCNALFCPRCYEYFCSCDCERFCSFGKHFSRIFSQSRQKKFSVRRAFTLVELLVVIAIIGVLIALLLP
jgi:prepilin-type N-terminal cleavage/methylation domain-containing protein